MQETWCCSQNGAYSRDIETISAQCPAEKLLHTVVKTEVRTGVLQVKAPLTVMHRESLVLSFNLGNSCWWNSCQGLLICCPGAHSHIPPQKIKISSTLPFFFFAFLSNLWLFLFIYLFFFFRCSRSPIFALVKSDFAHSGSLKCGRLIFRSETSTWATLSEYKSRRSG